MADLIDRQAAIDAVKDHGVSLEKKYYEKYGDISSEFFDGYKLAHHHIVELIYTKLPSADAVPVVRCWGKMDDLISRAELFNRLAPVQTLAEAYAVIQGMKTETEKIRKGHWVVKRVYDQCRKRSIQCSECGLVWSGDNWTWSFCPGCGAFNRKEV